jgi:hypothetical protein
MKIPLKDNLFPHIEDTDIAETYSIHNEGDDNHTVLNLDVVDRRELAKELKILYASVRKVNFAEQRKQRKDAEKIALLQERQRVIRSAYQVIERKTPPLKQHEGL